MIETEFSTAWRFAEYGGNTVHVNCGTTDIEEPAQRDERWGGFFFA